MASKNIQEWSQILKSTQPHAAALLDKNDNHSQLLCDQLNNLEKACGGIMEYLQRAKDLFHLLKTGYSPYSGYEVTVPEGIMLDPTVRLEEYLEHERIGMENIKNTFFCLVAGGIGERLGYKGIKVSVPVDLVTMRPFLSYYIDYMLQIQARCGEKVYFAIMTSDETHNLTIEFLKENQNFGMETDQIILMKQELVPAMLDADATLAINEKGFIDTKPHGHGDVHFLMYQTGTAQKMLSLGKKYFVVFQDTNILAWKIMPGMVGASVKNNLEVNWNVCPRKPKEQFDGYLKCKKEGREEVMPVEYFLLEDWLKTCGWKDGDVSNSQIGIGLPENADNSPFPGGTNIICFNLADYVKTLTRTKGILREFVNPKYADAERTKFKTPTRLETTMQSFNRILEDPSRATFTCFPRWLCFSAVKNDPVNAKAKFLAGIGPECAGSGEVDYYEANKRLLQLAGWQVPEAVSIPLAGINYQWPPKIIINPSFAVTLSEIIQKSKGVNKILSQDTTLVISGRNTTFENFQVEGAVQTQEKAYTGEFVGRGQKGSVVEIPINDPNLSPFLTMRGFKLEGLVLESI